MRFGARIFSMLTGNTGVSALVGNRVHPLIMPEGEAPPVVVYTIVSLSGLQTLDGQDLTKEAFVQFSCYARHYEDAHAVADAVEAVFEATSGRDLSQGPVAGSSKRRDLPAEVQPQWFHVALDVAMFTQDQ